MNHAQNLTASGLLALVGLNLAVLSFITPNAQAAPQKNELNPKTQDILLAQRLRSRRMIFRLSDRGLPVSRIGGAARGICDKDKDADQNTASKPVLPFIPLIPLAETGETVLPTISPRPMFFVYLPKTVAEQVEIIIRDQQSTTPIYSETLALKQTGGIVQVSLPPEKVSALETNRQYSWQLTVVCDPEADDQSSNQVIKGEIKRVDASASFSKVIQDATLADQAQLYAAEGYWLESLHALAQLRQNNPNDQTTLEDWNDLLSSVKLDAIAQEPILTNWAEKNPSIEK